MPKKIKKVLGSKKRKPKKTNLLGVVTHYFGKINVAAVKLSAPLKVGDYIEFKNGEESFCQLVESIQVNHKNILSARGKSEIGLKVVKEVKEGFQVLKAVQPTLLETVPAKKEESFKPIFNNVANPQNSETLTIIRRKILITNQVPQKEEKPAKDSFIVSPLPEKHGASLPETPQPQKPNPKKSGYNNVKFLKF
ncbi:hypothetical protein A3J90_06025 [candidate division WOR-1 bacterium RIFOXYC2_FULL_37_10]|uniref:Translation elongation factor EFTu-like domain-containing protein n=1 Tax=candidate division WOR-1 bacterium RIFOXYB2_FULL_37_13 TaxID=1802579 RepID=A0A1F4SWF2_UNCSA|nr:MAG: hypothetical protein A2310_04620 [candidate division WOR-1 bacterium RIFOXYB2_FULL_37_13]OGC34790.1 MAG: hypothetical protein A3J90_06025 [candidate division WOR-1 bacterium RIFOXYC2_FULL_37_10]